MGGTALGFQSVRLNSEEYFDFFEILIKELNDKHRGLSFTLIPAYGEKESFGDMDIVVSGYDDVWSDAVLKIMKSEKHVSKNGNVLSFGRETVHGIFQIDLIFTPGEKAVVDCAIDYYSFNDCGNLLGRLANRIGFKYGHKGLSYRLRDSENPKQVHGECHVTVNTREIHTFLGLNHDTFLEGFRTLEEMFQWVASSDYFDSSVYLLENRNAAGRIRDRKRATYNKFLQWCEENEKEPCFSGDVLDALIDYKFNYALKKWQLFGTSVKETEYNRSVAKYVSSLFNGDIVSKVTGLTKKELGLFMEHLLKGTVTNDVIINNARSIESMISKWFEDYQKGTVENLVISDRSFVGKDVIQRIESFYDAQYILTSDCYSVEGVRIHDRCLLFYANNPDTKLGHTHWFGMYRKMGGSLMIFGLDPDKTVIKFIRDGNTLHYSSHVHDWVKVGTSRFIDGGLDYAVSNANDFLIRLSIAEIFSKGYHLNKN